MQELQARLAGASILIRTKKVFDAGPFALYQAVKTFDIVERKGPGLHHPVRFDGHNCVCSVG